ncbi:MAG: tRNA (adenosine(37)-N6)-threonylcarbamoyltransferase complex dimerization subunit type 1 TsaB [Clostridia bacterium]|nr:tRNA (adenosine(37)-N6)-threonylcarbamoyltransferase complex dimerization subunit type 1 TsaB [Clostridia bacterium]
MKILSIDTSSKICGVAVLEGTSLIKEVSQDNGLTHSETLMPIIKEILDSINMSLNDINLIVCDKGPGSFTGIRIGVATAKAFSDSLNIGEIGISSLEALAYNVKTTGVICSLIDAKNDNVYAGVFENIDRDYISRRNFSCENISDLLDEFKDSEYSVTFVGDGAVNYKEKIISVLGKNCNFVENNDLSSFNLGLAGLAHFKKEDFCDVIPLYLRKPQAERMLENKKPIIY